jgi:hypothetical protein
MAGGDARATDFIKLYGWAKEMGGGPCPPFRLINRCAKRTLEKTFRTPMEIATMNECPNQQKNLEKCNCTYEPCPRKGICCECVSYHRAMGQLPACYFTPEVERTYDRSIARFLRANR